MSEIRVGPYRIIDNRLLLPAAEQQRLILGRGVEAELLVVKLEAENDQLRQRVKSLEDELALLTTKREPPPPTPPDHLPAS